MDCRVKPGDDEKIWVPVVKDETDMAKRVVGFIGLGLMGRGMAGNILRKGNDLLVMAHKNRAPVDLLVAEGAREVKSAREMAGAADVICICVTGSPEVEAVVRGDSGILAGAKP